MTPQKVSPENLRIARKGGFKAKQPKKPKMNASTLVLERYVARHNDWVKRVNAAAADQRKREKLQKAVRGY
jgi:hypothetical protein